MPAAESPTAPGPAATEDTVVLRYADPDKRMAGVRLQLDVPLSGQRLDFAKAAGGWLLRLARPPVDRLEYLFELTHADGGTETTTDPANPLRAPGAFGDKSALELPGYVRPSWLEGPSPPGRRRALPVPARAVRDEVEVTLWSPDGVEDDEPLPLLVAHDGPEYDELSGLTTYLSALVAAGTLPPVRAALLAPGDRDERYSANGAYTRALTLAVLPRLRAHLATTAVVGMGASLGALALLHAQRRHGDAFDALFLQSGSFFHPRYDEHERRFPHYDRIVRTVDGVLRAGGHHSPVPVVLTCGGIEENIANNRVMARALAAQGYDAVLHEVRDTHNYVAWRDAFHPHLTGLLREVAA